MAFDEQMISTPSEFANFMLEKELGHGGMGGVYLGRDKMLDRMVAIKVMLKRYGDDTTFVERFKKEAQAAAKLNHPNIAQIYSFDLYDGQPYIAMELVSGGSLDKMIEKSPGKLDPVFVMKVGQQIASALALAADQGLVHGDVKPENILFDNEGNGKLVDFGLAAMQENSKEIWGTPYYISPEKVRRQKVDFRADIYSLGGTLYHALTGVPPFEGETPTEVVKARFLGPPKRPSEVRPGIPEEIDEIILRMLEVEPALRYPTYQSLNGDLTRFLKKAGPVKKAGSGHKVVLKNRRPLSTTPATLTHSDLTAAVAAARAANADAAKPKNVGAMVGAVAGGIVALLLLVGGGLAWFVHHDKAVKEAQFQQQVVSVQKRAREAVEGNWKNAVQFEQNLRELCGKSIHEVSKATDEFLRIMDGKVTRELLVPAPPEALVAAMNPPEKKAGEEAAAAPAAAPARPAAPPPVDLSSVPAALRNSVEQMRALWADAYVCSQAVMVIHWKLSDLDEMRKKADTFTTQDKATADQLGKLSRDFADAYVLVKNDPVVSAAQKRSGVIANKSRNLIERVNKEIRRIVNEETKKADDAKRVAEAAAEAERKAAEYKAKMNDEMQLVETKYQNFKGTLLKHLDCTLVINQLTAVRGDLTTNEAKELADSYILGVRYMRGMQEYFAKVADGFKFKNGTVIKCASGKKDLTLQIPAGKANGSRARTQNLTWDQFIAKNAALFNELIIAFVERGRETQKLSLIEWSEHLMGCAMTLRVLFLDSQASAAKRAEDLVKMAVKEFKPAEAKAKRVFPDLGLGDADGL